MVPQFILQFATLGGKVVAGCWGLGCWVGAGLIWGISRPWGLIKFCWNWPWGLNWAWGGLNCWGNCLNWLWGLIWPWKGLIWDWGGLNCWTPCGNCMSWGPIWPTICGPIWNPLGNCWNCLPGLYGSNWLNFFCCKLNCCLKNGIFSGPLSNRYLGKK